MWIKIAAVGLGGAAGSLLRYGLSGLVYRWLGGGFAWGTLAVNLLGCFAIGVLTEFFTARLVGEAWRVFVLVGILGGFTTFSTLGYETSAMLRDGQWTLATLNVLASNILGVALVIAGFAVGRWL